MRTATNPNEGDDLLLRQMKYFAAVSECESFTEAAERCYISQSAISQQIRALEKELGIELIHRHNRGFTLTPAGRYFYLHCKTIIEQTEKLVQETRRLGNDSELHMCIGYLRSYGGSELHKVLAEFSKIYPEVSIDILTGNHEELYDFVRSGEADLILSDQRRAFSDTYVNYEMGKCGVYAELSSQNPLCEKGDAELEELRNIPCILISSKEQQATEREYYQKTLGFGGSYIFVETLEEGRLMTVSGRGFMPVESLGSLPAESDSICRLPVYERGKRLTRNYCVFWKKDNANYYIEEFADMLHSLTEKQMRD